MDHRKNVPGPKDLLLAFNTPGGKKASTYEIEKIDTRISVATSLGFICGQIRIKRGNLFICCLFYDAVEGRKKQKTRSGNNNYDIEEATH
jgi:hypothetical protein